MKTLLTGFGPFGSVENNPTERLVGHFAQHGAPGHALTTCVLPVSFRRAEAELEARLRREDFHAVLLMGVAQGETQLRIERFGRNRDAARIPDCDGYSPTSASIREGAPDVLTATVALDPLLAALTQANLPSRLSEDAGGYVCNHAYFTALRLLSEQTMQAGCLFLHVPSDPMTTRDPAKGYTLPLERQIKAVEITLAYLWTACAVSA